MKQKYFVKGAGVILIVAALVFSSFAVTADDVKPELFSKEVKDVNYTVKPNMNEDGRSDVIWDNDLTYGEALLACQYEPTYGELGSCADDFILEDILDILDVHWVAGYWNGDPGAFDWEITFYEDDGTGTSPGAIFAGPYMFQNAQCNEVFLELIDTSYYYSYSVDLPEVVTCAAGVKYWIGFQGQGVFPPQSGMAGHTSPQQLNQCKFKSAYFGYPNWVNGDVVFGVIYDLAFQLTGEGEPPVPAICCEGSLIWTDVKAGATVTGEFEVCNCGEEGSLLDFEVVSWPEWGNWTIDPLTATGIMAGDCVTVTVTVVAPPEKKKTFTGSVKIINLADPDDFCEIDVSLTTPRARYINSPLLLRLLERFDNLFAILKILF